MDQFEYDCLGAVNQFCNDDSFGTKMTKASGLNSGSSECDTLVINEDVPKKIRKKNNRKEKNFDSNSESDMDVSIEQISKSKTKEKDNSINFEEISLINDSNDAICVPFTNSTRRLRKSTRNAKNRNTISIDLSMENENPKKIINKKRSKKNVINLDDQFNGSQLSLSESNTSMLTDTNSEIIINVQWRNSIEKIPYRNFQKFADLMDIFAKRENCSVNDVLLNMENLIIGPDETPHSINYKFYDIICGRVVPNCNKISMKKDENKNGVLLKIQSNIWKKPVEISINKTEKFSVLCSKLVEEMNLNLEDFVLIFDGETLDLDETPEDLDFDGGELIDCKIKVDSNVVKEFEDKKKPKVMGRLRRRRR